MDAPVIFQAFLALDFRVYASKMPETVFEALTWSTVILLASLLAQGKEAPS